MKVAGTFSATTGEMVIPGSYRSIRDTVSPGGSLYWMDGNIWPLPPVELTNCEPGFYKDGLVWPPALPP